LVKVTKYRDFDSYLGVDLLLERLVLEIHVLNVYGLHIDWVPFWDSLLNKYLPKTKNLILGADLNFSFGEVEVWGPNAHPDNQTDLFTHLLNDQGVIDIAPLNLLPLWRNQWLGDARVAKRIDCFLFS
jgi:hypothetical protein